MKFIRGNSLIAIAVLTLYCGVNVAAEALHHHHATAVFPENLQPDDGLRLAALAPADDDDDDEEEDNCLLCKVLHLARTLPLALTIQGVTDLDGNVSSAVTICRPSPLPTATRARSPPPLA